jgi:hypothetical protein
MEPELWLGPKGAVGIRTDTGAGSPCWDHWAIILHRPGGDFFRVELPDHESRKSKDGQWKFATKFKGLTARKEY